MWRPTDVVGRRVAGYIIDTLIPGAIFVGLWVALTGGGGGEITGPDYGLTSVPADNRTLWFVLVVGIWLPYYVVIPGLTGKTPGKLLTGTAIVKADGSPPGILRQLVRQLLWIVDGLFLNLVAFVTALSSKNHQRVGDMVAKTYVVRSQAAGSKILLRRR